MAAVSALSGFGAGSSLMLSRTRTRRGRGSRKTAMGIVMKLDVADQAGQPGSDKSRQEGTLKQIGQQRTLEPASLEVAQAGDQELKVLRAAMKEVAELAAATQKQAEDAKRALAATKELTGQPTLESTIARATKKEAADKYKYRKFERWETEGDPTKPLGLLGGVWLGCVLVYNIWAACRTA